MDYYNSEAMSEQNTTSYVAADGAMSKAIEAWQSQTSAEWSTDGLEAACWAFHEHMMALKEVPVSAEERRIPMDRQQAITSLKQGLACLFPYSGPRHNPNDDPDQTRAHDQRLMYEALDVLSQPASDPSVPDRFGDIFADEVRGGTSRI
jgi:hypothetical protein